MTAHVLSTAHHCSRAACSRASCSGRGVYRPSFLFVFTNGVHRTVRPDVTLCEEHGQDLVERFRQRHWQAQIDASLPPGCAQVEWKRSRLALSR